MLFIVFFVMGMLIQHLFAYKTMKKKRYTGRFDYVPEKNCPMDPKIKAFCHPYQIMYTFAVCDETVYQN